MDREKLNEAADNYARENSWYPGETSYESDITAMEESFSDTFKAGVEWLQSQPLSERLTEEELEKIRDYMELRECGALDAIDTVEFIESIFGTDLFNDKSE